MESDLTGQLVGYRVLRRLGGGEHSTTFLGREIAPSGGPDSTVRDSVSDDMQPATVQEPVECVAIRVFEASADAAALAREIRALCAVRGGGVPALYDVATLPDGRVALVEERLSGISAGRMLHQLNRIEAGEAVTIIAPVVAALAELHSLDLVHTGLSLATISFAASGRPVLTGLGDLVDATPRRADQGAAQSVPDRSDLIRADYTRLTAVMRAVFEHLDNGTARNRRAEPLAAWFEMATTAIPFLPCLGELERRLFEWAPGAPLRAVQSPAGQRSSDPTAAVRDGAVLASREEDGTGDVVDSGPRRLGVVAALLRAMMNELWSVGRVVRQGAPPVSRSAVNTIEQRTPIHRRFAAWLRRKRSPLIVASLLAAAVLVLVLTVVPSSRDDTRVASTQNGALPTIPDNADADPVVDDDAMVSGDDPVAATSVLLKRRDTCIQEVSLSKRLAANT